jgi:hypothetical protein
MQTHENVCPLPHPGLDLLLWTASSSLQHFDEYTFYHASDKSGIQFDTAAPFLHLDLYDTEASYMQFAVHNKGNILLHIVCAHSQAFSSPSK